MIHFINHMPMNSSKIQWRWCFFNQSYRKRHVNNFFQTRHNKWVKMSSKELAQTTLSLWVSALFCVCLVLYISVPVGYNPFKKKQDHSTMKASMATLTSRVLNFSLIKFCFLCKFVWIYSQTLSSSSLFLLSPFTKSSANAPWQKETI